jgi:hypothetical protein
VLALQRDRLVVLHAAASGLEVPEPLRRRAGLLIAPRWEPPAEAPPAAAPGAAAAGAAASETKDATPIGDEEVDADDVGEESADAGPPLDAPGDVDAGTEGAGGGLEGTGQDAGGAVLPVEPAPAGTSPALVRARSLRTLGGLPIEPPTKPASESAEDGEDEEDSLIVGSARRSQGDIASVSALVGV